MTHTAKLQQSCSVQGGAILPFYVFFSILDLIRGYLVLSCLAAHLCLER